MSIKTSLLGLLVLLAGCAEPSGVPHPVCGDEWADLDPIITSADAGGDENPIPIECIAEIDTQRVRIGFSLPPGPDCHVLRRVELVESADAVAITLVGGVVDDPRAGACSDEPRRAVTEVDLQAPVDGRMLLDGSG